MPVQDAALCVGNWNGTLSETNDPQGLTNYSVSLAVDTNGWGSLSNAFSGTGWIFALASTNGALSGFFNTTLDSNNPYNQFQISGTLSGNVISGSFESEGDAVGTVSLTRQ